MTVTVTSALAGPATARYSNVYGALVDLGVLSGLGAQDVTGSGDPVAPILNASEFYAPLTHSLVLTRGTGSATFTRATKAWEFGYSAAANSGDSQVLMEIASGTPRFGGARYDAGTWYNTYADGSAISASSLLGYHPEGERTNSLLWARDLTNAAWAKTNITAAKTATGIDNAANSASTLTAGAADATILQTLSLAAAPRSFSTYVTRRTGVGPVYITRDGFTTEVDISGSLQVGSLADPTKRYRVKIENSSVLNPQVGFKIATSGDEIDVDVCQDEAGAMASSPIVTTTAAVTRNGDRLLYEKDGNLADAAGSALASWCIDSSETTYGSTSRNALVVDTSGRVLYGAAGGNVGNGGMYDGTSSVHSTGATARNNKNHVKNASKWSGVSMSVVNGSAAMATAAYDGTMGAGASIDVGGNASGSNQYGYIRNIYIWSTALTDAQLQQVTA